ncbi:hypothetical protein PP724_22965 [Ralstonia solanacearum]|uniref:hypothetical protein n=1 Tax=Ralstonia solanacearum TaxID=305 RepID=UPI001FF829B3|nr:hypothetical protein [Ralstonia solanacearum]MDC6237029.1 hypothetical protein [Ralstonia solanacearum]MDD7810568.1 hypothetical protein [Ralstonia solanacearum]
MRETPNQDNAAAVRVHEQCEDRVNRQPNPPRSEIVDMQVREAWRREHEIDAARDSAKPGAKVGGLRDAVVTPVALPVQADPASDDLMDELNAVLRNAETDE